MPQLLIKRVGVVLVSFAILVGAFFLSLSKPKYSFEYFTADCRIFNVSGKLLFFLNSPLCAFTDDGKVLSSKPYLDTFMLQDKNNEVLWTSHEHVHHDLKFTADQKAILLITAEVINFQGEEVKSDCFSKRDLNNRIISHWCLSENIDELIKLGFPITKLKIERVLSKDRAAVRFEISHANSIYEIPSNSISNKISAFQSGNYLVNLFVPLNALLVLDRDMKKILWSKSLKGVVLEGKEVHLITHDDHVLPDGKILMYANRFYKRLPGTGDQVVFENQESEWQSSLVTYDPLTERASFVFDPNRYKAFKSDFQGSVNRLPNNNFFVSETSPVAKVTELDPSGRIAWSFEIPVKNIQTARPVYNSNFLKSRKIIVD